jgi:hypothetical protein
VREGLLNAVESAEADPETRAVVICCSGIDARDLSHRSPSARTVVSDCYQWRRWESKTSDFAGNQATTGDHGKQDPELPEPKDSEKHVRETALPTGKTERETTQGRADVGDLPTAETLGTLARGVLSSSRHAESRELARAVLRLPAPWKEQS